MQITWDLVVLVSLAVGTLYGAFMGRNKIMGILVYMYLGLAVAQACGELVYGWVANFGFISARLATSDFGVKILIFLLVALLLMFKSEISGLDSDGTLTKIEAGVLGFLAAAFALASIFTFMTEAELQGLSSNFALIIYTYRAGIIVVPVLAMVGLSFLRRR
jgi:hypothetical protein